MIKRELEEEETLRAAWCSHLACVSKERTGGGSCHAGPGSCQGYRIHTKDLWEMRKRRGGGWGAAGLCFSEIPRRMCSAVGDVGIDIQEHWRRTDYSDSVDDRREGRAPWMWECLHQEPAQLHSFLFMEIFGPQFREMWRLHDQGYSRTAGHSRV